MLSVGSENNNLTALLSLLSKEFKLNFKFPRNQKESLLGFSDY
jgi:hypothetical protein